MFVAFTRGFQVDSFVSVLDYDCGTAFRWWNKLGASLRADDSQPDLPSVGQMLWRIADCIPALALVYDSADSDDRFWVKLEHGVGKLAHTTDVPSVKHHFPDFVIFLFKNRDILSVRTPKTVSDILDLRRQSNDPRLLLWRVPEVLDDTDLFFNTLVHLKGEGSLVYKAFVNGFGNVDLVFDRYLPMLGPTSPFSMVYIMGSIYAERARAIGNFRSVSHALFSRLMSVIKSENVALAVEAFRFVTIIFSVSKAVGETEEYARWLKELLDAVAGVPHLRIVTVRFCMEIQVQIHSRMGQLCESIVNWNTSDGSDVFLMCQMVNVTESKVTLPMIQFFFSKGVENELYANVSAQSLLSLLGKPLTEEIFAWIRHFLRRCFIFVAVSSERRKYTNRTNAILRFCEALCHLNLKAIKELIVRCYSTVVVGKYIKTIIYAIPVDISGDFSFRSEIESNLKKCTNLKQLLKVEIGSAIDRSVSEKDMGKKVVLPLLRKNPQIKTPGRRSNLQTRNNPVVGRNGLPRKERR